MTQSLAQLYGLRVPITSPAEYDLIANKELPNLAKASTRDFVGIEIEIENLTSYDQAVNHLQSEQTAREQKFQHGIAHLWNIHRDGSLRNNGIEYVTIPIHISSLESAITWLYGFIKQRYPQAQFTERCGIHIHYDFTQVSGDMFRYFIPIYQVIERLLFEYVVRKDRETSNFCVPLYNFDPSSWFPSGTSDPNRVLNSIPHQDTAKYSALNVTRMVDYGTVEVRHLPGTWDIGYIMRFAHIIQKLKEYLYSTEFVKNFNNFLNNANTISNYHQWLLQVFDAELTDVILPVNADLSLISQGVTTAKKFLLSLESENLQRRMGTSQLLKDKELATRLSKFMEKRKVIPQIPSPTAPPNWEDTLVNLAFTNALQGEPQTPQGRAGRPGMSATTRYTTRDLEDAAMALNSTNPTGETS